MNINNAIVETASKAGLECISTGGGFDYVHRAFLNGMEDIITAPRGDGSPGNIAAPATVVIYKDNDWRSGIEIHHNDCVTAILALSQMTEFPVDPSSQRI